MFPEDLRGKKKFDVAKDLLLIIMTDYERDQIVKVYDVMSTEVAKQVSAPISNHHDSPAKMAMDWINYYSHDGERPPYFASVPKLWKENIFDDEVAWKPKFPGGHHS